jgi:hypothetical protein
MQEASMLGLIAGDKTETRRKLGMQRNPGMAWSWTDKIDSQGTHYGIQVGGIAPRVLMARAPHMVGDTLYTRESYKAAYRRKRDGAIQVIYKADGRQVYLPVPEGKEVRLSDHWRPGRFMFKFMARYWLRVVSVMPGPLQAITETGAQREGIFNQGGEWWIPGGDIGYRDSIEAYRAWWDSMHGGTIWHWKANPEVWAIRFEVLRADPYNLAEG